MFKLSANTFYKSFFLFAAALLLCAAAALVWHLTRLSHSPAAASTAATAPPNKKNPRNSENPRANAAVIVQTGFAINRDLAIVQSGLGTVVPAAEVSVRARVSGRLEKILFTEGQWVQKGELLAELDARPFAADLAQVEGQAARNRALLANTQADLRRFTSLGQQTAISAQQIDAQTSLVEQYKGLVQADVGAVEKARLQLEFTQIRAPIAGRIGLRQLDPGNNISPQDPQPLALITQVNPIDVVFALPGEQASELSAQLQSARSDKRSLSVEAWDKANKVRLGAGELLSLDNQIDAGTGAIKLKARFNNEGGQLFANQFVNVRVQTQQLPQVLVVPSKAIVRGSDGPFVYALTQADAPTSPNPKAFSQDVAQDSTTSKQPAAKQASPALVAAVKPVTLGVTQGEFTQIATGLEPGDEVVVSGADRLREGVQVRVTNPAAAALTEAQTETPPQPSLRAF
ncbi:MAG TPA: efflux RND transporter periplasmic adaptor subunit [Cellvibrionaceae bacterium]